MYLFNAKIEDPEKLEKMLVGRAPIVNTLVAAQIQHSKGGIPPQFLVVGPRGSGKTHMLRIIYDRLSRNTEFMDVHEIAYMVEDETGIASYFDLLQRIFEALKRWSNDEQKKRFIVEQVENLKEIHPKDWSKSAEDILLRFLDGKSLLILIENFDSILKGIDRKNAVQELAKLRDFIQQYNQLSFIATSQSLINSLSDNQNPLYGFFNIIQLKRLTLDESFEYVKKVALSENNDELVQFLETHDGKGHLEAIHQFTKGNHRLLLVFFDFLKAEFRSNLSDVFLKSIDELKPYYESFIRNLAPQQQKIVQYLCLQRNPQKGADIGRNCFLDKNTVSKQLSELQLLGYVSAVNEKGRDKYYEINEPLLRMCIEINEDRNGIIKIFVNFLGQLYTAEQLKEKYLHYNYLERFQPEPIRKLYQSEAKIYEMVRSQFLSSWKVAKEEEEKLNMCCEPDEAKKIIFELSHLNENTNIVFEQIKELILKQEWEKAIDIIRKQIAIDPTDPNLYSSLGALYGLNEQFEMSIEAFLKATEIDPDVETLWKGLGHSYSAAKYHYKAIECFQKAIDICPNNDDTWNSLGNLFDETEQYEKAIEAYQRASEIKPDNVEIWNKLSFVYFKTKQYNCAIETGLKVVEIEPDDADVWYILGFLYDFTEKYSNAIDAFQKAIKIKPENAGIWNNLGLVFNRQKQMISAKDAFTKAINFSNDRENGDTSEFYSNLIEVQFALKETAEALSSIEALFSKPERIEFITKLEDALVLLCKENSEDAVKEVFNKLLQICEANGANEKLSALLSNVVFRILREYQEIKPFRIELLQHILEELFSRKPEFTYPLRYLSIGIRYFLKDEKEAIYEMSQEERMIFEKFTSPDSKE